MLDETLPGKNRLLRTWLALMLLTLISMLSALAGTADWSPLPIWGALLVLVSTGFKVQQVLMVYLNLRVSSGGWKGGFLCLLAAILLLIFSGYLAARYAG
ncbi:MAG: cytochrome C oxidase subunit IV family protein [Porticoccaceae bacterium]|jgi:hypothetical protein